MGNPSSVAARRRSPQRRKQFNGRMVKGVFCFVLVVAFADLATALPYRPAPQEGEESNETSEDLQQLEGNPDFVIMSSCFVEATDGDGNLDEQTLENCVQCFEKTDGQETYALEVEAVKNCTIEYLPNFYEDCKDGFDPATDSSDEVMGCFMDFVEVFDQTGEIRQAVKELIGFLNQLIKVSF